MIVHELELLPLMWNVIAFVFGVLVGFIISEFTQRR
jgi:uncharacterized membrane-anchored protein YhcB (DUF1043 family)